jgi:hypothetical protein
MLCILPHLISGQFVEHCEPSVLQKIHLTGREFLYHLPCESSARKLDGFGGRWLTPKAAVWPDRVVVSPPSFDDDVGVDPHRPPISVIG